MPYVIESMSSDIQLKLPEGLLLTSRLLA